MYRDNKVHVDQPVTETTSLGMSRLRQRLRKASSVKGFKSSGMGWEKDPLLDRLKTSGESVVKLLISFLLVATEIPG